MKNLMKTGYPITLSLVCALVVAAPVSALDLDEVSAAIEAVKAATAKYADVEAALADGYIPDPSGECAAIPGVGGMGMHYIRPDLLGLLPPGDRVDGTGIHTDFDNPAILLYEPQDDGSLVLVGAENLVFAAAWEAAGNTEPPVFAGRDWDYMENDPNTDIDEAHGFTAHYDQHVYFRGDDVLAAVQPFHPDVTCMHHVGVQAEHSH